MNLLVLIEDLRKRFALGSDEKDYLDSFYNGDCEPDMNDDPTDNWEQGMELGNIRTKAELLYFLDHWIIQHKYFN